MRTTLLLNASFEPLCVISARRAVVLVLADKADVIAESTDEVRSARLALAAPSVIRLRYFVKVPYRAALPLNRRNLAGRDGGRCAYCGEKGSTIDHVVPRSRGGRHEWDNVVLACLPCNSRKGDRLLAELGWALRFRPTAPAGWSWLVIGVANVDPDWEPWIPAGTPIAASA
jgi:5-methylcytosine-specific restriction endonuclease McrA